MVIFTLIRVSNFSMIVFTISHLIRICYLVYLTFVGYNALYSDKFTALSQSDPNMYGGLATVMAVIVWPRLVVISMIGLFCIYAAVCGKCYCKCNLGGDDDYEEEYVEVVE